MRTVHPTKAEKRRAERGIALLLVIFSLLLLTAITAAMLFSSNTETNIATNFRDKTIADYAATSGLQEARDRIQPLSGDLGIGSGGVTYVPTDVPSPTNKGQVLYIINPRNGETVAPWDPTNAYADTELCQEGNMKAALGINQNAPGSPCNPKTQIPSPHKCDPVGTAPSGWCTFATAWSKGTPLDYKWVRITLKADNSTPVWVAPTPASANGTEVCWDSNLHQQLQKPAGAGVDCLGATSGSPVKSVTLNTNGTGYSSTPTVSFIGGGGSGAKAIANVTAVAGGIQSATLSPKGSGYTSAPTVTFAAVPDGTGATFSALITGSPVTSLNIPNSNYCYAKGTTGLSVGFVPTPPPTAGGAATATVSMTGQACITSATINAACGKSMKGQPITINLAGGFSASFTLDNQGKYSGPVKPTNVGSYTTLPAPKSVTVSGCSIPITSFTGGIQIQSPPNLTSGGEYVTAPTATIQGTPPVAPNGSQPSVSVGWAAVGSNGQLNKITVTTTGSGYAQSTYALSITGGGGSGAVGTAISGATQHITGITVTNGGGGYTSPPLVQITDATGTGASATAILQGGQKLLYGRVYLLTSMARTQSGTIAMSQMEVGVAPPWNFQLGGALTIAGAAPTFGAASSSGFAIHGDDAAGNGNVEPTGCDKTAGNSLPAIGVYDTAAQQCVVNGSFTNSCGKTVSCDGSVDPCTGEATPNTAGLLLNKQANYTGAQSAPDIYVTAAANPDPAELQTMVTDISTTPGAQLLTGPLTINNWNVGSPTNLQTVVVNGDLTLGGSPSGYGVLVVTGNMIFNGNFTWHGVVLVLGSAQVVNKGGGNGQITGAFYVANDQGSSLGSAQFNWNGGGGNGIQYDHCWADDLLNKYPPTASDKALQVLSTRMMQF